MTLMDLEASECINLLKPMKCPCGCGHYAEMVIGERKGDNIFTVANALLGKIDCNNAWIFIIENWAISGAYTNEDY